MIYCQELLLEEPTILLKTSRAGISADPKLILPHTNTNSSKLSSMKKRVYVFCTIILWLQKNEVGSPLIVLDAIYL